MQFHPATYSLAEITPGVCADPPPSRALRDIKDRGPGVVKINLRGPRRGAINSADSTILFAGFQLRAREGNDIGTLRQASARTPAEEAVRQSIKLADAPAAPLPLAAAAGVAPGVAQF